MQRPSLCSVLTIRQEIYGALTYYYGLTASESLLQRKPEVKWVIPVAGIPLIQTHWQSTCRQLSRRPRKYNDCLPARRYASAGYRDRNVSVRLSVTRRYCVKTKKASSMISSPSGSPKTLVFWRQISSPNSKGFPLYGGLKHGSVGKIQRFFSFKRLYLENGSRYGQSYY